MFPFLFLISPRVITKNLMGMSRFWVLLCLSTLSLGNKVSYADDADAEVEVHTYERAEDGAGYIASAGGRYDGCHTTTISNVLPPPYGNLSDTILCTPIWNAFVLRYFQREDNVLTIILSAVYTTGWVGIGFSNNGKMVGSSAMVGWVNKKGIPRIKQYYLQGTQTTQVIPDKGELQLENVPPVVVLQGTMIYLAFQVKFQSQVSHQPIILAFSSTYPTKSGHLPIHEDKTTVLVDFTKGEVRVVDVPTTYKITHGIMGIMGWGLLLPLGAIVARYMRHKDPLWYYLHAIIQLLGFLFGLATVLLGLQLYNKLRADIPAHRGIGIFLLVLSILQVMAILLRPKKDVKVRKYWNWYHHWTGRISLFFGAFNIILGIILADAGSDLKVGYGLLLSMTILAVIVLEVLRMKSSKNSPPPSTFR